MARNLKDAFYNAQYRVGQGIYTRAVSQGDNSLTEANFTQHETFDNLIEDDVDAMPEFVDSQISMEDASSNGVAMDKISASQTAMDAVSSSQTAMDAVAASQTAIQSVFASTLARKASFESQYQSSYYTGNGLGIWYGMFLDLNETQIGLSSITLRNADDHPAVNSSWNLPSGVSYSATINNAALSSDTADVVGTGGQSLNIDAGSGNSEYSFLAYTLIDVSNGSTLKISLKDTTGNGETLIWVDGERWLAFEGNTSYQEFTYDVSSMSGEIPVTLGYYTRSQVNMFFDELRLE